MAIEYRPDLRYSVLGKTGSGKTVFIIVLVCLLVPMDSQDWEIWWADTKDYPPDLAALYRWGFRDADTPAGKLTPRKIFKLRAAENLSEEEAKVELARQASVLTRAALKRTAVLVVYDEWNHVVLSTQRAGAGVDRGQKSGRGKIGTVGGVQEPVLTPRVLFSQASILALFNLTHLGDIKIARELCPFYAPDWPGTPDPLPDPHGFWIKWLDGHGEDGRWAYWKSVQEWRASVEIG